MKIIKAQSRHCIVPLDDCSTLFFTWKKVVINMLSGRFRFSLKFATMVWIFLWHEFSLCSPDIFTQIPSFLKFLKRHESQFEMTMSKVNFYFFSFLVRSSLVKGQLSWKFSLIRKYHKFRSMVGQAVSNRGSCRYHLRPTSSNILESLSLFTLIANISLWFHTFVVQVNTRLCWTFIRRWYDVLDFIRTMQSH